MNNPDYSKYLSPKNQKAYEVNDKNYQRKVFTDISLIYEDDKFLGVFPKNTAGGFGIQMDHDKYDPLEYLINANSLVNGEGDSKAYTHNSIWKLVTEDKAAVEEKHQDNEDKKTNLTTWHREIETLIFNMLASSNRAEFETNKQKLEEDLKAKSESKYINGAEASTEQMARDAYKLIQESTLLEDPLYNMKP